MGALKILISASISIFTISTAPTAVNAAPFSEETAIQNLCLIGFQTAFAQAGQTPPEGMGAFTCRCLIQRLQGGESLNPARESCKLEASRRFRILPKG